MGKHAVPQSTWAALQVAIVSGALTMEEASAKFDIPLGTIKARSARHRWFNRPPKEADPDKGITMPRVQVAEAQGLRVAEDTLQPPATHATMVAPSPPLADQKPKLAATTVAQAVTDEHTENGKRFRVAMGRALAKGAEEAASMDGQELVLEATKISQLTKAGSLHFGAGRGSGGSANGLVVNFNFLVRPDEGPSDIVEVEEVREI